MTALTALTNSTECPVKGNQGTETISLSATLWPNLAGSLGKSP